ncbi:MAG: HEAT repeat domain-containing protein [Lentisphaeria bacterium]
MSRIKLIICGVIGLLLISLAAVLLNPRPSSIGDPQEASLNAREARLLESQRRGVVTDKNLLRSRTHESRMFQRSTPESQAKLQALLGRLESEDDNESVDALLEAEDLCSAELLSFVQRALNLPGQREIRKEAFDLILGYNRPDLLPMIQQAFSDHDNELRLAALEALENIGQPADDDEADDSGEDVEEEQEVELSDQDREAILRIFADAFNDVDPEIRLQALASLQQMELSLQVEGFKLAQQSTYEDVRSNVMHVTGTSANWDTMEIAINALDDPNPDIQEAAAENIDFYIGKTFDSSSEAKEWWQNNKYLFDDDLFLEDLDNLHVIED